MAEIIPDDFDFAQYYAETDVSAKIRPASTYSEAIRRRFVPDEQRIPSPSMFSTKLRGRLEFRPGELTVWGGYSKHRKSIATGQVMLDLCVQDQRTLCASFEMQPAVTLERMWRQAAGKRFPTEAECDALDRWSNGRLWVFDHLGEISPTAVLGLVRYAAEELKITQVFLDSLMMICSSEDKFDEQKQFVTRLVRLAIELNIHIHLIAHCKKPSGPKGEDSPPTKYDIRGTSAITDQAFNIVTVWANKGKAEASDLDLAKQDEPDAIISVCGQRNGAYEGKVGLWFDGRSMRLLDDRTSPVEGYEFMRQAW